jgi:hypothetical protein
MVRFFLSALLLLSLNACNNEVADRLQSGRVLSFLGLEGRWVGPVTPQAENCGQPTKGLMTVDRKTFSFDPFEGTTVIEGTVSDDNHFDGALSRPGPDHQVVSITFSGSVAQSDAGGDGINGRLESGRCSWAVDLKRG